MLTAIIILTFLSFKDELIGFIDLYSTLQGNKAVYAVNSFVAGTLGAIEFYWDFWIIAQIDQKFWTYLGLMTVVNFLGTIFGVWVLHHKPKLKHWIKRKRQSKSMIKLWKERKLLGGLDDQTKTTETTPNEGNKTSGTVNKNTLQCDDQVRKLRDDTPGSGSKRGNPTG